MLQTYADLGAGQQHALFRLEVLALVLHDGEGLPAIKAYHDLLTGTQGVLDGVGISRWVRLLEDVADAIDDSVPRGLQLDLRSGWRSARGGNHQGHHECGV